MTDLKTNIRFDRLITIQQTTETQNTSGELENAWGTYKQPWAHKDDGAGKEEYSASKETAFLGTVWTIRKNDAPAVTEKMRITHDSKTYDILNIAEVGRGRFYKITTQLRQ